MVRSRRQEVLWSANDNLEKSITVEVHPHGVDSGALASSDCMSCLWLSRSSEINNGAARRRSFSGSTVDKHRPDRDFALKDCAPGISCRKVQVFATTTDSAVAAPTSHAWADCGRVNHRLTTCASATSSE